MAFEEIGAQGLVHALARLGGLLEEAAALRYIFRCADTQVCIIRYTTRSCQRVKTLDGFDWSWPKKINRAQVQHVFRLDFLPQHGNVILLGGVGVGKTHLAIALAHTACLKGRTTLFTSAVDIVNALAAAQATGGIKREMARLLKPSLLVVDELGYLPIDKFGADALFQVISQRYERGSTIITTNRAFKNWPEIFNNDSTLTSALLDRLLHHAESIVIEGRSYRMRDQSDT
jgi:DNA replication protein DnaC